MEKVNKIFSKLFDIKATKDQWILLITTAYVSFITAFVSSSLASNCAVCSLNESFTSSINLASCVSGIFIGKLWTKIVRNRLMKNYLIYVGLECLIFSLIYIILCIRIDNWNPFYYKIIGLVYTTIIGRFIGRSQSVIKSAVWPKNNDRERYSINEANILPIAALIGFISIKLFHPSLQLSLILLSSVCIVDDIGWAIIWFKNKTNIIKYIEEHKDI